MVFISYTVDCGVDILKLIEMFVCIKHISIPIFLVLEINRIKSFVEKTEDLFCFRNASFERLLLIVFVMFRFHLFWFCWNPPIAWIRPYLHLLSACLLFWRALRPLTIFLPSNSILGVAIKAMPSIACLCHLLCSWPSPWISGSSSGSFSLKIPLKGMSSDISWIFS